MTFHIIDRACARIGIGHSSRYCLRPLAALLLGVVAFLPAAAQSAEPATATTATANADKSFDVYEYRVLGNTVLPVRDVERAVYPYLGDHKTLADVEAARLALENAYHAKGFATVFVDIPEQDINENVVRLRATEGRLHETRISGARYFSERKILAAVPAAAPGTVPQLQLLQQQLTAVNSQTTDRSVVPILKAGPEPGTVDLALKVDDHLPLHASAEVNNQYTPNTETLRAIVGLSYTNLFAELDGVSAQYQTTPQKPSQVGVFAANYTTRVFADGERYSLTYIHSSSEVPALSTLGVLGKGDIFSGRFIYSIPSIPGAHSVTLGMDYKHFAETIQLDATHGVATPVSYVNFSLAFAADWRTERHGFSFGTTANFGPHIIVNDETAFANKRYQGRSNYFYVRADSAYNTKLPADFVLTARAASQIAFDPLITNESYSISGANTVRGYLEAESLSDMGINGTLQFGSPSIHWRETALLDGFVFFDAGRAYIIKSQAGQVDRSLRSAGAGLDLLPGRGVTGSLTWAYPLVDSVNTRRGDSRVLFVVRGSF